MTSLYPAAMGETENINIRTAAQEDHGQLLGLRTRLWPNSPAEEHARELTQILERKAVVTLPLIVLMAGTKLGEIAGFVEVDLRSHADGCNPLSPAGYVEGWYVAENRRHHGVGRKLMTAAEN